MSWSMPQSAAPLPPNQPTAPPGPLQLGDAFSGTWATYKAGWKVFFTLAIAPVLISAAGAVVVIVAVVGAVYSTVRNTLRGDLAAVFTGMSTAFFGLAILTVIVALLVSLFNNVFLGRMMVATLDYATGREVPTWANLAGRTRGLLGRVAGYMLIIAGIVIGAYLAVSLVVFLILAAMKQNVGLSVFLIVIVSLATLLAAFWFSVSTIYCPLVVAEEGLTGMAAVKRSFALTKGVFWRTLGYLIVLGFALSIVNGVLTPLTNSDNSALTTIGSLLAMAVSFVLIPVFSIWVSLMYLGRTRELANPGGYPGGPAPVMPWVDQGQPFGQLPGQYSDPTGYPFPQAPYPGSADQPTAHPGAQQPQPPYPGAPQQPPYPGPPQQQPYPGAPSPQPPYPGAPQQPPYPGPPQPPYPGPPQQPPYPGAPDQGQPGAQGQPGGDNPFGPPQR